MHTNNVTSVLARRKDIEPSTRNRPLVGFASPTAFELVMRLLTSLEQKVDALATRPPDQVMVTPERAEADVQEDVVEAPVETRKPLIERSRLLRFFD